MGTEVIITDHHTPGPTLPEAAAIINPRIDGSAYPYSHLCGAGLAFKLIQGLCQFYGQPWDTGLLELAALGTIADLVPLTDENRYLVREGLKAMTETRRPGLRALYRQGRIDGESIDADTVAYQIAPRLNSAGRMGHARVSLELLTTDSEQQAEALAAELEEFNLRRRELSTQSYQAAIEQLGEGEGLPAVLIVDHPYFTPGVAGLVAGRLLESYNRPAIALAAVEGDRLTASARSLPTFNMVEAIAQCQDLLARFGGHAQAAGFTISRRNVPEFIARMTALGEAALGGQAPDNVTSVDAEVGLPGLDSETLAWMAEMEPWGVENPAPVFLSRGVHVMETRYIGNQGQHLRLRVRQGNSEWTALAFNHAEKWVEGTPYLDLIFTITRDSWRGVMRHNLRLLDFWASN
jgi:single-stranded-DNA-specific exonuclease